MGFTTRAAAVAFLTLGVLGSVGACSSSSDDAGACEDAIQIDKFKELMIIDDGVVQDPRSSNANNGPWSFRHTVENLASGDTTEWLTTWFESWKTVTEVNGVPTDRPNESRGVQVEDRLICQWAKRVPSNNCDVNCTTCTAKKLDLAVAPFRLIAVVNRIDVLDEQVNSPNGEGRLVFAFTDGPGDDPASKPLPMSVIFEFFLPDSTPAKDWAKKWHELGSFPDQGEAYRAKLQEITDGFTTRGSRPTGINGSSIATVRTNESVFDWIWQLREFHLAPDGNLHLALARNTPAEAFNGSKVLTDWVTANAASIRARRFEMPSSMLGPSVDQLVYTWELPSLDPQLAIDFKKQTCNGCHTFHEPAVDNVFHISPFRSGTAKLSPFIFDPKGGPDELTKRSASMKRTMCR